MRIYLKEQAKEILEYAFLELFSKFQISFYEDLIDAVYNSLGPS